MNGKGFWFTWGLVLVSGLALTPILSFAKWLPHAGWAGIGASLAIPPAMFIALLALAGILMGSHFAVRALRPDGGPEKAATSAGGFPSLEKGLRIAFWITLACEAGVVFFWILPSYQGQVREATPGMEVSWVLSSLRAIGYVLAEILAASVVLCYSNVGRTWRAIVTFLGAVALGGAIWWGSATLWFLHRGLPELGGHYGQGELGGLAQTLLWVAISILILRSPLKCWPAFLVAPLYGIQSLWRIVMVVRGTAMAVLPYGISSSETWMGKLGEALQEGLLRWVFVSFNYLSSLSILALLAVCARKARRSAEATASDSYLPSKAKWNALCFAMAAALAWVLVHFTPVDFAETISRGGYWGLGLPLFLGTFLWLLYFSLWRLFAAGFSRWDTWRGRAAAFVSAMFLIGYLGYLLMPIQYPNW